jgi:hypothetical protein
MSTETELQLATIQDLVKRLVAAGALNLEGLDETQK